MTNSKLLNSVPAYLICLRFIKIVYFSLKNTAGKEIYNIFNSYSIPLSLKHFITNRTNKQTHNNNRVFMYYLLDT